MSDESNPLREGTPEERTARPTALVIFGASGDLTRRKLFPAIYNLALSRLLPGGFAVVGVARRPKPDFADDMKQNVAKFSRRKPLDDATWNDLAKGISYVQGDFDADPTTFTRLKTELERLDRERGTQGNRVFYLSVGPREVTAIVKGLREHGLIQPPAPDAPYQHVIVEKPFGIDLPSAQVLNRELLAHLAESQIYRIDHYLGKETVQNLLVLRFGNTIFEPLWSRQHVDHVQITVAEEIGVEGRGNFWDKIGITRDIVQNHALQILTLVAMEPPSSLGADAVRDEKVKVLRSLRPIAGKDVLTRTVRGQYAAGTVRGDKVPGYRAEPEVHAENPDTTTETYVAMKLNLESWRWGGVPFYLRAGKRLAKRITEVALHFKSLPHGLFRGMRGASDEPNSLVMRIQPDEGISLRFATKVPGQGIAMRDVAMDFRYGTEFGSSTPEAYERLILDAMRGEATLFTRADEVEAQWGFIDPIRAGWAEQHAPLAFYEAGTWGPREADELLDSARRLEAAVSSGAVSEAVAKIEAELGTFWAQAHDEGGGTKARAATMNFVAVASPAEASAVRAEVEELAETRAGRVFLMTVDGRLAPWDLGHDVNAVCHKEGDTVLCYDRVELSFGAMAAGRAASVLGALALSEVPTILEVGRGAPAVLVDPLTKVVGRVVVDTAHTTVLRVAEIARKRETPIADRAWVRTFSWRELTARFFDGAVAATRAIRKVTIERTWDGKHDPAALFLGWLGSRLGWRFDGPTRARGADGVEIALSVRDHAADIGPGEIGAVRLSTSLDGQPLELACERAGDHRTVRWSMAGARAAAHHHPLGFRDEGWVLLKAIDGTEADAVYRQAVLAAADWSAR